MSTIPTSVTEEHFNQHIRPLLSSARRGYICKIAIIKVFNYILYRLHTGCQWSELPIAPDADHPEKKRLAGKQSTTTFRSGVPMAVWNEFGSTVLRRSAKTSICRS